MLTKKINRLKGSLITKITLILMAVILPLFFLCILINTYGTGLISSIIVNNTRAVSKESLNRLEDNISRIFTYESRLILDAALVSDMQSSTLVSKYTKLNELLEAQKKFDTVYQSTDFIKDLRLHLPEAQKTVGFYQGISDLNTDEFDYFTEQLKTTPKKRSGIFTRDNKLFVVTVNDSYSIQRSQPPNAMCIIELDNAPLIEDMRIFTDESMMGNYILSTADDSFKCTKVNNETAANEVWELSKNRPAGDFTANVDSEKILVVKSIGEKLGLTLTCYIPHDTLFRQLSGFSSVIYAFAALLIFAFAIILLLLYRTLYRPIREMTGAFRRVEDGNFSTTLTRKSNDELGYAFSAFNRMTTRLDRLIKDEYEHTIAMQKASLKQLQAQINPHFLYNSFYILKHRIKSYDNESAAEFADYLGDYFKFITKEQADFVPLSSEYDHALTYIKIQLIRFRDKIEFTADKIPTDFCEIQVPRLILQPIVENAFVHGFDHSDQKGAISIRIIQKGCDHLEITVENSAGNMDEHTFSHLKKELEDGVRVDDNISGLSNISMRLKQLYGGDFGLSVSMSQGGFCVKMLLRRT